MSNNLQEKQVDSTLLHQGSFFNLYKDKVLLPDQNYAYREYITHPKAVVVVPVFDNGDIILVQQYRYALKKVFIELPAGKVDANEDFDLAAKRELLEETGFKANRVEKICNFYPCIGYSDEEMYLYLAQDLSEQEQATDHDEFIEPMRVSYKKAMDMIEAGKINDLKSIAGLYRVRDYIQKFSDPR